MKKKILITLISLTVALSIIVCGCGNKNNSMGEVEATEEIETTEEIDTSSIIEIDESTETEVVATESIEITDSDIAQYSSLEITDEGYVIQTNNMTICYNIPYDVPSIVKQLNDDGFDFTKEGVINLIACGYDPLDRGVIENTDTGAFGETLPGEGTGMAKFQAWVRSQGADYALGWTFVYENGKAAGSQPTYGVYMKEGSELYGTVYHVGDIPPGGTRLTGTPEEYKQMMKDGIVEAMEESGKISFVNPKTGRRVWGTLEEIEAYKAANGFD